jgi:hypothetical protein
VGLELNGTHQLLVYADHAKPGGNYANIWVLKLAFKEADVKEKLKKRK